MKNRITTLLGLTICFILLTQITYAIDPDGYRRVKPLDVIIYPEQVEPNSVFIIVTAMYNNSRPVFSLNNISINENIITFWVDSLESTNGESNISGQSIHNRINNLSVGNYTLLIRDSISNQTLASRTFNISVYGLFLDENGLIGVMGAFKGIESNGSIYLLPHPSVVVSPPWLFQHTNIWTSNNGTFHIALRFINYQIKKEGLNFSVHAPENISISPGNCTIGTLDTNYGVLCILKVNVTNLKHGVYNIGYNLTYKENGEVKNKTSIIPLGIYEIYEKAEFINESMEIITTFYSPFNDSVNYTSGDWANISLFNDSNRILHLPLSISYTADYSNFTRQEPHSPLPNVVIGAAIGGIIGGGVVAYYKYQEGAPLDLDTVSDVVGGALLGGGLGALAGASLGAGIPGAVAAFSAESVQFGFYSGAALKAAQVVGKNQGVPVTNDDVIQVYAGGIQECAIDLVSEGVAIESSYKATNDWVNLHRANKPIATGGKVIDLWDDGQRVAAVDKFNSWATIQAKSTLKLAKTIENSKIINTINTYTTLDKYYDSAVFIQGVHYRRFSNLEYEYTSNFNGYPGNSPFSQQDDDGDGVINLDEYLYGTDPFDSSSAPRLNVGVSCPSEVVEGSTFTVSATVENTGTEAVSNVRAGILGQGEQNIVRIPASGRWIAPFYLVANQAGEYTVPFYVESDNAGSMARTCLVRVKPKTDIQISLISPRTVQKDNEFDVYVQVKNLQGSEATNVKATLALSTGFVLQSGGMDKVIGTIPAGGSMSTSWRLKAITDGTHDLGVGVTSDKPGTVSASTRIEVKSSSSGCFIATAAFGSPLVGELDILRSFRDGFLEKNPLGESFVETYYETSPPIADVIREKEDLRPLVRDYFVLPFVYLVQPVNKAKDLGLVEILIVLGFVGFLFSINALEKSGRKRVAISIVDGVFNSLIYVFIFTVVVLGLGGLSSLVPWTAVIAAYLLPLFFFGLIVIIGVTLAFLRNRKTFGSVLLGGEK